MSGAEQDRQMAEELNRQGTNKPEINSGKVSDGTVSLLGYASAAPGLARLLEPHVDKLVNEIIPLDFRSNDLGRYEEAAKIIVSKRTKPHPDGSTQLYYDTEGLVNVLAQSLSAVSGMSLEESSRELGYVLRGAETRAVRHNAFTHGKLFGGGVGSSGVGPPPYWEIGTNPLRPHVNNSGKTTGSED